VSDEPAKVRAYEARDQDAIVALLDGREPWTRLGYAADDWRRLLAPPLENREAWIVEDAGAPAGIAVVRPRFLVGDYLELFAIAATAEGRGLGRTLLAAVERVVFARSRNFFICVSDFNQAARRFYARSGYQEVGVLADLLVAGSAEILLRKTTGPQRKSKTTFTAP